MKTKPMSQQAEALARMEGREFYALFMEQGTGKTWCILADAERLYAQGKIDALFIVAPKGVHRNWIRREIPKHMDDHGHIIARAWAKGGARARRKLEDLFKPREPGEVPPLRIFSINIDALNTKDGFDFAMRFVRSTRALGVIDESQRIKNPNTKRTHAVMRLKPLLPYRRIASGTPITNKPIDVFSQMEFLEHGLLGTTSYRAFVAEYSELVSNDSPMMKRMVQRNPRAAHAQIVAKDPITGRPKWRNLDKLQKLIEPHAYRKLKRECLDLPPKIYKVHPFELSPAQQRAYDLMAEEKRIALDDGQQMSVERLAAIAKLQQITSGYVIPPTPKALPGEPVPPAPDPVYVAEGNPRIDALAEVLEDVEGQFIIWAKYHEEIRAVAALLRRLGITYGEYHGRVPDAERDAVEDAFHRGEIRCFLGNPAAGGTGLTLTEAETVIYYSCSYDLEHRLQSEDRAHRVGTVRNVVYIDLVAVGTIDEQIAEALQNKSELAAEVLGDRADVISSDN